MENDIREDGALVDVGRPLKASLECVGMGGKAGGLRTAALALREVERRGLKISLLALANEFEAAADNLDAQALKIMPTLCCGTEQ